MVKNYIIFLFSVDIVNNVIDPLQLLLLLLLLIIIFIIIIIIYFLMVILLFCLLLLLFKKIACRCPAFPLDKCR